MSKILGIKKGKNKEGNPSYVYYFSDDYSVISGQPKVNQENPS